MRAVRRIAANGVCLLGLQQLLVRDLEDRYIQEILKLTGGRKIDAARVLAIGPRTLYPRVTR